jgi:RNA-directed DNA polymerase
MEKRYWKDGKFTAKEKYRLRMHSETPIIRHVKVQGSRSPYDGDRAYWSKRLRNYPMFKTEQGILLRRCKGKCVYCGLDFRDGDILEVDHHIPLYLGGKNTLENKDILHRHCHDQRHAAFEESRRKAKQLADAYHNAEHAPQMTGAHDKS